MTFSTARVTIQTTKLPRCGGFTASGEYFLTTFYPTVPFGAHGNSGEIVVKEHNLSLYFVVESTKNNQKAPDIVVRFAFGTVSKNGEL